MMFVYASGHTEAAKSVLARINDAIIFPFMTLLTAVALLVFLYGVFEYVYNAGDEGARKTGRTHMIFGVIGLLVMVSALAILRLAAATFGVSVPN